MQLTIHENCTKKLFIMCSRKCVIGFFFYFYNNSNIVLYVVKMFFNYTVYECLN